ncbi:PA2169 family four-helix-bundle protein [Sphingomonas histidinilytica]|uniref:ferritin-like domain-containing protein n=1 Tax=Rhizorhabdus histidinilytica TaxID=439228 RepID=UPI001ADC872A|nr:PA2169 family four-helix-bundle protein [Rhizorhabdus histidinilytica]MBO9375590.1 PA2169 family four-helix-bundle protein [Rhizorhabdus histidinilytica]
MSDTHDVSVLNGLITTTLDSIKDFEDAAEDAKSTRFATIFADFARDRAQVVASLQARVRALGDKPEERSSLLGAAHRSFMNLKQALTGKNDKAVVEEVERGEDHIKAKFGEALRDPDLQPATLAVIREASASVKAGHDQASALKHSLV